MIGLSAFEVGVGRLPGLTGETFNQAQYQPKCNLSRAQSRIIGAYFLKCVTFRGSRVVSRGLTTKCRTGVPHTEHSNAQLRSYNKVWVLYKGVL